MRISYEETISSACETGSKQGTTLLVQSGNSRVPTTGTVSVKRETFEILLRQVRVVHCCIVDDSTRSLTLRKWHKAVLQTPSD